METRDYLNRLQPSRSFRAGKHSFRHHEHQSNTTGFSKGCSLKGQQEPKIKPYSTGLVSILVCMYPKSVAKKTTTTLMKQCWCYLFKAMLVGRRLGISGKPSMKDKNSFGSTKLDRAKMQAISLRSSIQIRYKYSSTVQTNSGMSFACLMLYLYVPVLSTSFYSSTYLLPAGSLPAWYCTEYLLVQ